MYKLILQNKTLTGIILILILIVTLIMLNQWINNVTSNSLTTPANEPSLRAKFAYLSAHGNSSCSGDFLTSIPSMSDSSRLQGSCCSPMALGRYENQIQGLSKYKDIQQIPSDPYDIPAKLAKELLVYDKTINPTADEQKILDKAVADSPEKGYCCCKCWRWYVYEGLSKYLVHNKHFTSSQITDVLANSDGCGGTG